MWWAVMGGRLVYRRGMLSWYICGGWAAVRTVTGHSGGLGDDGARWIDYCTLFMRPINQVQAYHTFGTPLRVSHRLAL